MIKNINQLALNNTERLRELKNLCDSEGKFLVPVELTAKTVASILKETKVYYELELLLISHYCNIKYVVVKNFRAKLGDIRKSFTVIELAEFNLLIKSSEIF